MKFCHSALIGLLLLLCLPESGAQEIYTLERPETVTFGNGYEVVDNDGNFVKRVDGPAQANVQAYVDVNGVRYFMSDWSLQRFQQGHAPNWMKAIPEPQPAMSNRVSAEEADRIAGNTPTYQPPPASEPTAEEMALDLLNSANDFINMGTLQRAEGNLAIVEDAITNDKSVSREFKNEFLRVKGKLLIRQGKGNEASDLLAELIRNREFASIEVARMLSEIGDTEGALKQYDQIIDDGRLDLRSPPLLREILTAFLATGDFSRIDSLPDRVAKSDRYAIEMLGDVLGDLNMWKLALQAFELAASFRDDTSATLEEKLGTARQRLGNLKEAEKHWTAAKEAGRRAVFELEQARYLAARGKLSDAGKHYFAFANEIEPVGGTKLAVTEEYHGKEESALVEAAQFLDGIGEQEKAAGVFQIAVDHSINGPLLLSLTLPQWAAFHEKNQTVGEATELLQSWIDSGKVPDAQAGRAWGILGDKEKATRLLQAAARDLDENRELDDEFIGETFDRLDHAAHVFVGAGKPDRFLLDVVIRLGVAPRNLDPGWPEGLRANIFTAALLDNDDEVLKASAAERLLRDRALMQRIIDVYPETKRIASAKELRPFDVPFSLGDPEIAANAVLQFKGVVLDSLARDRVRLQRFESSTTDSSDIELLRRLKELYLQQAASGVVIEKLSAIESRILRLEADLFAAEPDGAGRLDLEEIDFRKVQAELESGEALVEFCLYGHITGLDRHEKRYAAVVIPSEGSPQLIPLGSESEVNAGLSALQNALAEENIAKIGNSPDIRKQVFDGIELGAVLAYNRILKPLEAHLEAIDRLYLSPDGILHFVPFAALVSTDGKFVSEKWKVSVVGSGRDLLSDSAVSGELKGRSAMLLANPAFESSPPGAGESLASPAGATLLASLDQQVSSSRSAVRNLRGLLGDLPGTVAEVDRIAPILEESGMLVHRSVGAEITESILEWDEAPAVLHLGTHGVFLPQSFNEDSGSNPFVNLVDPMARSFIALTGADQTLELWEEGEVPDPRGDGVVLAAELANLDLQGTRLVVLSACQTGLGDVVEGEGVFGMKRSLRQAGAENLVTTLWNISDAGTGEVMEQFYKELADSDQPGEALAETQRLLLRRYADEMTFGEAIYLVGPFVADEIRR